MPTSKTQTPSDDVARVARAIATLRERYKLTQRQAAEAHEDDISYQYWGQNETAKVAGIVKPATQRKLLAAISKAAGLEHPLTLDDLADEMAEQDGGGMHEEGRSFRMARALTGDRRSSAPTERQAVFPVRDGEVVISFPAHMTPEGFKELGAYFAAFLNAKIPTED